MKAIRFQISLAFLCVYLCWGATYVATKVGVDALPALILAGTRMSAAGLLMLGFCLWRGKQLLWEPRIMLRLALLGVLLLCGGNLGLVWAERTLGAGLSALLIAVVPLYVAVLEWFLPGGESLRGRGVLGLVLGVGALLALLWPSLQSVNRGNPRQLIAAAALFAGALSWSMGSVTSRRMRLPVDPLVAACWEMLTAGAVDLILGTALGQWKETIWTRLSVEAVGFLIVFGSLLGFSAYTWLIHHVPVAKVATYAYVNPVIAVILGALILGERLQMTEYVGMVMVVAAVALVTSSQTTTRVPADPAAAVEA